MAKLIYNPIAHQDEFHEDDETKILGLSGGYGSGKTYSLVMKIFKLSMLNKNLPGGLLAPSMPEYKKDVLPTMRDILEEHDIDYYYHKTDKIWKFPWSRGSLYIFTGENKIRGPNLSYFGINEASLIEYDRFKEALGRVRIKTAKCPQVVLSFTPEGIAHWTYEHFVENPRPGTRLIYADTRANPHLDPTYIQMLENNYDQKMLEAYLMGKFVNMNGHQFYYSFARDVNCDKSIKQDENEMVHVGMDFNVQPMAASLWNIKGRLHAAFDEILIKDNADTQQMCDALRARGCFPENTIIYPDPSGDARSTKSFSDIQILRNNGYYNIRFKNKAPAFRQRQLCINNLLAKGLIKINPIKCPNLVKDFEAVEQNIADFSKVKKDVKLTHFSDGADYFLDYVNPISGSKPSVRVERIR